LAVFAFGLFASLASARAAEPLTVAQLLAGGARYDNTVVSVVGFLQLEFENHALYEGKDPDVNLGRRPSVWVDTRNSDLTNEMYGRRTVALEGTFVFGPSGHMGRSPGVIRNITHVEIVP
jgi:hypothetical protein